MPILLDFEAVSTSVNLNMGVVIILIHAYLDEFLRTSVFEILMLILK
jgi:hypothetical protein